MEPFLYSFMYVCMYMCIHVDVFIRSFNHVKFLTKSCKKNKNSHPFKVNV